MSYVESTKVIHLGRNGGLVQRSAHWSWLGKTTIDICTSRAAAEGRLFIVEEGGRDTGGMQMEAHDHLRCWHCPVLSRKLPVLVLGAEE
jgi:hypothetical protein